jgi:hypothetical protein
MRETLDALRAELPRRLAAGPAGAESLRPYAPALRRLAAQVPACARLADAVERAARVKDGTAALLDLLGLVRQAAAALAVSGVAGDLEPLLPSGPWATPGAAVELAALVEVLGQSGSGREKALADAVTRGALADLRLVEPLLQCLEDRYAAFADVVADKALPELGPGLARELELRTDPAGGPGAARCLRVLCEVDLEGGPRRCRELLRGASEALRVQALESLAQTEAGQSVDDALACVQDKSARVRGAAYAVLAAAALAGRGRALEALLRGLGEPDAVWQRIKPSLVRIERGVRERLAAELETMLAAQGGKAKAGVNRGTARRAACRLVEVLGERSDRKQSLPVLLPLAREAPPPARAAALYAIGQCGLRANGVLEVVLAGLRDEVEEVAYAAVRALPVRGTEVREAAPVLQGVIANTRFSSHVRDLAVLAYGNVAPRDRESADYLVGLLRAEGGTNMVRCRAAEALATFGPAARTALPALGEILLETPDWMLPYYLAAPLLALDPDASVAVPLLIRVLTEPRYQGRRKPALQAFQRYPERARPAIPALEALAAGDSREEAYIAQRILARLGHSS